MNGSQQAGCVATVGRSLSTLCWLFIVALFVGGSLKRLLFPGPNEPSRDLVLLLVVWTVLALLWFRVRALAFRPSGPVGGRMGFFSEFMQGYREARAARDPKPDSPSHDGSSDSSAFRDKEAELLREVRDLKAALAQAAEENAGLRAELAMGNDKQGMDQQARARIADWRSRPRRSLVFTI
jgi:hypothetical protein